jgi:plasmid stabilization system protein ParE
MSFRVFRSERAAAEIEEIATYLAESSLPAAQRFLDALKNTQRQLADFPNSGAPGLLPGTRRLVIGNYIVSYRRRGSDVEIFAVRHARRRGCTRANIVLSPGRNR